jgi:benzylsuccinate CoA-transferase BbsF subunit
MSKPPLDGIRIADFCWAWAGPYGALQLAHLGAEVIRIESQTRLCPSRMIPPWADNEPGINRCGYFNQYNQGKRSLSLDLKKPEGIQIAKKTRRHKRYCDRELCRRGDGKNGPGL